MLNIIKCSFNVLRLKARTQKQKEEGRRKEEKGKFDLVELT